MISGAVVLALTTSSQSAKPFFSKIDGSFGRSYPYGASPEVAKRVVDYACRSVYEDDFEWTASTTVEQIAKRIEILVSKSFSEANVSSPSPFLGQLVRANAVAAFTVRWVSYDNDTALAAESDPKLGYLTVERGTPEWVLKNRKTVCYGFARFQREIARAIGLDCVMTGGSYRGVKADRTVDQPNHMWVTYRLPNNVWAPSDASGFQAFLPRGLKVGERWSVKGKIGEHFLVSLEPEAREVFQTMHFGWDRYDKRDGDAQRVFLPSGWKTDTWNTLAKDHPEVPEMAFRFFGWYQQRDIATARG